MSPIPRPEPLRHSTAAMQRMAGVDPTASWDFRPGQRVMTAEGIAGTVDSVDDGPGVGAENYNVTLDGGLGGGQYDGRHLSALGGIDATAALASEDYPELEEILQERPPLEHGIAVSSAWVVTDPEGNVKASETYAQDAKDEAAPGDTVESRTDEQEFSGFATGRDAETTDYPIALGSITPVTITSGLPNALVPDRFEDDGKGAWSYDWCRFRRDERCYYPKQLNDEATKTEGYAVWVPVDRGFCPRAKWDDQKTCPVGEPGPHSGQPNALLDATIPYEEGGQRGGIPAHASLEAPGADRDILLTAAADPSFRFHFTASWSDVQRKAKRIRQEGGVRIVSSTGTHIVAEVKGDHNVYQSVLMRQAGRKTVAMWECGCKWASYSWGRTGRWKRFEGRMCSHALALNYEASAQEWMGGTIKEQPVAPAWRTDPVFDTPALQRQDEKQIAASLVIHASADGDFARFLDTVRPGLGDLWLDDPDRYYEIYNALAKHQQDKIDAEERLKDKWLWGASLKTAMPAIKTNPSIKEIVDWYSNLAQAQVGTTTRMLDDLAGHNGGKMEGLQFRIKGRDSLERKIKEKMNRGGDPRYWIKDALRYTIVFHPADYSAQVQDVLFGAQELGFKIGEEENSWGRGDSYSGLHYILESPNGTPIELQFHTQDSFDLKNKTLHRLYEEFRDSGTSVARRQELFDIMTAYWDDVDIPDDVLEYPVEKHYLRPVGVHSSLATAPEDLLKQAWRGQGVMGKYQGRLVQILALLPGGMVRLQGDLVVPCSQVFHPKYDPRAGLNFHGSIHQAEITPADPDEGLRGVEEACAKGTHTHSGLVIKAVDSGRVLLTQRTPYSEDPEGVSGRWEFPGGGIEEGESALESAIREFGEETGLTLPEDARVDGCYENGPYLAIIVLVPNEAWTTNAELLTFETMGIGWFHPDDIQGADIVREELDATEWDMVREALHHPVLAWTEPGTKEYDAHTELNNAVRDGKKTKPSKCSKCGKGGRINGHHSNYDKPLDVTWLCDSCHQSHHAKESALITLEEVQAVAKEADVLDTFGWGESPIQFWVDSEEPEGFADPLAPIEAPPAVLDPPQPPAGYPYVDPWPVAASVEQEAILHDEPEPALPEVLGSEPDAVDAMVAMALRDQGGIAAPVAAAGLEWIMQGSPASQQSSNDIADAAAQFLATGKPPEAPGIQSTAAAVFSPAEQRAIINEGEGVTAANLGDLDIKGTHYEALEASLEDDDLTLW